MALTKSSVLHYWSSRFGINPRIGGRPVFTRNSAGTFASQESEVNSAIVNTPRFDWATVSGERRKVLTLELARTNPILRASDFSNAIWTGVTRTVTTGIADPAGGTSACTITATGANALITQSVGAGSSLARTNSVWLRRRTGTGTINLAKPDNSTYTTVTLTSSWQRFSAVGAASVTRYAEIQIATNGDAIDAWNFQMDDATFITSEIATTTAAATRATDSCYWNFPPVPQAMMLYVRFVEQGTLQVANARILGIGSVGPADPYISILENGGVYTAQHNNGSSVLGTVTGVPALGDTVELVMVLFSTGAVQLIQSTNGAAVTSAGISGTKALLGAWSDTRLWANSVGTIAQGSTRLAEIKIVKYADVVAGTNQGIMDELRALELGPNADLL